MSVAGLIIDRKGPESMPFRGAASLTVWQLTGPRLHNDTFTVRSRWHTNTRSQVHNAQTHILRNTNKFGSTHAQLHTNIQKHMRIHSHARTYTLIHLRCGDNTWQAESQHHADSINTYKTSQAIKTSCIHSRKGLMETNICLCHVKEAVQLPHCKQKNIAKAASLGIGFLSKPHSRGRT